VSSTRVVVEVQNDLSKATQERESGKTPNIKKLDDRTMIEALTEVTTSFASSELKGVIVLERGYSDKTEEAWVVVGISDKTIKAARDVKTMGAEPRVDKKTEESDALGRQPSEVRRARCYGRSSPACLFGSSSSDCSQLSPISYGRG
jgi:hypothetical protein